MIISFLSGRKFLYKSEWATNQHRDTLSSHVGHYDQLSYYAVAQNESIGRVRMQMLEVSITLYWLIFLNASSRDSFSMTFKSSCCEIISCFIRKCLSHVDRE